MFGIPIAVTQICIVLASSVTNILLGELPDVDYYIATYGVVQQLTMIANYIMLGFMQGFQTVVVFSFGAKDRERFRISEKFALKGVLVISLAVEAIYILLSKNLTMIFNQHDKSV